MIPRTKILMLAALPCLLFGLGINAVAQAGRLAGTVAYVAPGARAVAAQGARVVAVGAYSQSETRTDNNGNFVMVLRPGGYRILAQGAYGYVQYQEVSGNVRAGADSYITPNPIFLVPQRGRSSDGAPGNPYGQVVTRTEPSAVTYEVATENACGDDPGDLYGSVRIKEGNQPAKDATVRAVGPSRSQPVPTGPNGEFCIKSLPPGEYTIIVGVRDSRYRPETIVKGYVKARGVSEVSPNPILLVR